MIETDSMMTAGHIIKLEVIIGTMRTLEVGVTTEIIGIEVNIVQVVEGTLRIETGHMKEAEAGIGIIVEDLGAEERVDLEIDIDLTLRVKCSREVSLL